MTAEPAFSPPARALIVAAALVIVIAGIQAASSVVATVLLAVFIAVVASRPLRWLSRHGWPKWAALFVVLFVLVDFGSLFALLATGALEGFRDSLPSYQERLVLFSQQIGGWLEGMGFEASRETVPAVLDPAGAIAVARRLASSVGGLFASGVLVLLTVAFILLEASTLPAKLKQALRFDEQANARVAQVFDAINRYMLIKALTSLGTALAAWAWLSILGVDFAVLWGLLAFVLNFVPFVGSFLMAIPPVLVALVQTDIQTTLLVAVGYLVINTAIGNILEPRIMGRDLGLSVLGIFLSLLFWGWVLGPVGVFLSVPLTMALKVACEASSHTRPIALLLGPEIPPAPPAEPKGEPETTPSPEAQAKVDPEVAPKGQRG
jgi:predicted PurR-regulated permease PerM